MGGWGGVVLSGLVGAASGAGTALKEDALEREKIEAQRVRDEYLSKLRVNEHRQMADIDIANLPRKQQAEFDVKYANRGKQDEITQGHEAAQTRGKIEGQGGLILNQGQSVFDKEGNLVMQGPKVEEDPELKKAKLDELQARVRELDARAGAERDRAAAYRDSVDKKGAKAEKPIAPKFVYDKDAKVYVDQNQTGLTMTIEAGEEAVPAKEGGLFGIGSREGKPSTPPKQRYFADGVEVSAADVQKVYPGFAAKINAGSLNEAKPAVSESTPEPEKKGRSAGGKIGGLTSARTVVARGVDKKTGQRVVKYSDGSIELE